jgi:protease I
LADARSDIFSLGSTLFFLLTGRSPFEAGSFTAMISKGVQREMVPLTSLRNDLPAELVAIVERMMALKPSDRFASVVEVAEALTPFGRGEKTGTSDPKTNDDAGASELQGLVEAEAVEPTPEKPSSKSRSISRRRPVVDTEFGEEPTKWREEEVPAWRKRSRGRGRPVRPSLQVLIERFARRWGRQVAVLLLAVGVLYGVASWMWPDRSDGDLANNSSSVPAVNAPNRETVGADKRSSKRVLMLVPAWSFWWPDYGPSREMLEKAGVQVTVTSWQREAHPLKDGGGSSVPVDVLLSDVRAADYDALFIVGGPGIVSLVQGKSDGLDAQRLVKEMLAKDRLVTAICMGPIVLAKAGILDGVPATGSRYIQDKCRQEFGISLTDADVEWHGNIITGRDAEVGDQFVRVLLKALAKKG